MWHWYLKIQCNGCGTYFKEKIQSRVAQHGGSRQQSGGKSGETHIYGNVISINPEISTRCYGATEEKIINLLKKSGKDMEDTDIHT